LLLQALFFAIFARTILKTAMQKRPLSQAEVYQKLMRYCAYQERSSYDVLQKLRLWGIGGNQAKDSLEFLQEEGFVDDARFAAAYVRGKFNANKWGRNKIREGLYAKKIPKQIIESAMEELDDENYVQQLQDLLEKKNAALKEDDPYKRKQKLALYAQAKGYELDLIWKTLDKIL
jgi:regulatory protein